MEELWAAREFANADFGDARRTARLVSLALTFSNKPAASIPEACSGWAETTAAYRLFSSDRVTPKEILASHRDATLQRIKGQSVILIAQDTTTLNFTTHHAAKGMGPIGKKGLRGFFMHSALAVSTEGVPLGLLAAEFLVRQDQDPEGEKTRSKLPPEERESFRWQRVLAASTQDLPPNVLAITVADREADYYDFLAAAKHTDKPVLIRAKHDRRLAEEGNPHLQAKLLASPSLGTITVQIPRSEDRPSRTATLEVRAMPATFLPPRDPQHKALPALDMWAISAREVSPVPEGDEAVEWLLLTIIAVPDLAQAQQCIVWYTYRWRIERFHFTLKSGCRVEKLELEERKRIERALALFCVIAWRLLSITYLARMTPEQPCTTVLSSSEWQALYSVINKTPVPPPTPPDLRTAVRWIARLGGFLGRRRDGDPGVKVLWRGFRDLQRISEMWEILQHKT